MNLETLLALPRTVKKILFVIHDIAVIFAAFWFTQSLKANYNAEWFQLANWQAFATTTVLTVLLFIRLGLYRAVTRYVGGLVLVLVLLGSFVSTVIFFLSVFYFEQRLRLALPIVYFLSLLVLVAGSRFILRMILAAVQSPHSHTPVVIYGAGRSGRQLLEAMKQGHGYRIIAFIDDNPFIQNTTIHNLNVYAPAQLVGLIQKYGIKKILLAMPSANRQRHSEIIRSLEHYPCEVLQIPRMRDLVDGKITISSLKKISLEDLLGRDPVAPQDDLMAQDIRGKVVMVTGAGGSIGSELCRQIIRRQPAKLLLFELSEFSLYSIDKELREWQQLHGNATEILPLLGSVQQCKRLLSVMQTFGVQTIYHAAAYKHVPMVEFNSLEGVRNNVYGTLFCAQAAIDAQVETFVLISTDKAVRPTNTMGASKRMAELVLQALAAEPHHHTRFCMVRFGNVLGSSGSVVPVFEQQIAQGGPVTLTHPDITRFFMTIPEAAQLVIQAGAMGKGGDVFVLDMGEPVKIMDLARQMIRLSGLEVKDDEHPHGDIAIQITGLRPGEKLYEELLIGEAVAPTSHPRIMTAQEVMLPWQELSVLLEQMNGACKEGNQQQVREILLTAPTGFVPKDDICDLVWVAKQTAAFSDIPQTS